MSENFLLYDKLKRIADNFYSGKIPAQVLENLQEHQHFTKALVSYRNHVDELAKDSKFRCMSHKVISEQFPPVNSEIEKNYIIDSMFYNPYKQKSITVAITYGCSCRCKQCYSTEYMDSSRKELTVDQFKTLFKKVTDQGAWHIDITGGEPFDHPQFFEVIDQIPKDKATTMVATNGIKLNKETIEKIKQSNIMVLKVSLDSYKKSDHDKNRAVENAYDHVVKGIRLALENNIYVFIQAFVQRDCWKDNELEKRIQVCLDLGIRKFHIITPLNIGNLAKRKDLLLTEKDREYIYGLRDKYKDSGTVISVFPDWELHNGCLSGRGRVYINPYGDIYPCNFDNDKCYGNILTHELPDVISRIQKDIPEKRHFCVASNVTIDLLKKLGAQSNIIYGKNKSSFHLLSPMIRRPRKDNILYDQTETKRARLFIEKEYLQSGEVAAIAEKIDKGIAAVENYVNIRLEKPLDYYIKNGDFLSHTRDDCIILARVKENFSPYLHETVHFIVKPLLSCLWLSEGLAVYLNEKLGGDPCFPNGKTKLDEAAKQYMDNPDYRSNDFNLQTKNTDFDLLNLPARRKFYNYAGSFVKFLDNTMGIEKLMTIYKSWDISRDFNTVAGKSAEEYRSEWEQYLKALDTLLV